MENDKSKSKKRSWKLRPWDDNFLTVLAGAFERAKETKDSIYDANAPKVANLKLNDDSNALGYAVFIEKATLGMDLSS